MEITESALTAQYQRASSAWPFIHQTELARGLPRMLLFAVGSRETNLTNEVGDFGHGHGVWQLDDRSHTPPGGFTRFDMNVPLQCAIAATMLQGMLAITGGNVEEAAAIYNSGRRGEFGTTHHDYGIDVRQRMQSLQRKFGNGSRVQPGTQVHTTGRERNPETMTARDQIVRTALGFNGTCNGQGYNGPNPFSANLRRPAEAWCGDYVTDIYKRAQIPLPSMQPGCRTGFAYCPDAVEYGRKHHATRNSWQAEPGDIVLFDWDGHGLADHTEIATGYQAGVLFTIGGNSGPSNVDGFGGQGGVHRHRWNAPPGHGNDQVLVVIDTTKVVRLGGPAHLTRKGTAPPARPRLLMLKSPMMTGADVRAVQQALNQRNHAGLAVDGAYGPLTRDAVLNWQRRAHIDVDGITGPQTGASLGLPA